MRENFTNHTAPHGQSLTGPRIDNCASLMLESIKISTFKPLLAAKTPVELQSASFFVHD
jgi:hypothetical protein